MIGPVHFPAVLVEVVGHSTNPVEHARGSVPSKIDLCFAVVLAVNNFRQVDHAP